MPLVVAFHLNGKKWLEKSESTGWLSNKAVRTCHVEAAEMERLVKGLRDTGLSEILKRKQYFQLDLGLIIMHVIILFI